MKFNLSRLKSTRASMVLLISLLTVSTILPLKIIGKTINTNKITNKMRPATLKNFFMIVLFINRCKITDLFWYGKIKVKIYLKLNEKNVYICSADTHRI
jgi:hypothetical protein